MEVSCKTFIVDMQLFMMGIIYNLVYTVVSNNNVLYIHA